MLAGSGLFQDMACSDKEVDVGGREKEAVGNGKLALPGLGGYKCFRVVGPAAGAIGRTRYS